MLTGRGCSRAIFYVKHVWDSTNAAVFTSACDDRFQSNSSPLLLSARLAFCTGFVCLASKCLNCAIMSKQPPLQYEIESSEHLTDLLAEPGLKGACSIHNDRLKRRGRLLFLYQEDLQGTPSCVVVELYSAWCGCCKSVVPTFKRIRMEKDDEALLRFLCLLYTSPSPRD